MSSQSDISQSSIEQQDGTEYTNSCAAAAVAAAPSLAGDIIGDGSYVQSGNLKAASLPRGACTPIRPFQETFLRSRLSCLTDSEPSAYLVLLSYFSIKVQ